MVEHLVADVMERHVQQPIIGYKDAEAGPEAVRVLDGWTRTLAARVAGLDTVPVLVHEQPPDDDELLESSLQANAMRLDMNDFEYAAVYAQISRNVAARVRSWPHGSTSRPPPCPSGFARSTASRRTCAACSAKARASFAAVA